MEFTSEELKLIERLRKRERQWHWIRWALLGASAFTVVCYGYISVSLYHRLHWEALTVEDAFLFAFFWPKILIAIWIAAWFAVWPLTSWRGNATRLLLLKLLDAQKGNKGNEKTG
jgi:hypothetical protein